MIINEENLYKLFEYFSYPKPWIKRYAYLPKTINGQRVWLTHYYRRVNVRTNIFGNRDEYYEYGTLFDVLKDNS